MLFYSQLQRLPIVDSQGRKLAFLRDLAIRREGVLPVVYGLVAKRWPDHRWLLPWDRIERLEHDRVLLKPGVNLVEFDRPSEGEELLSANVLDRQVVDVTGAKVVRINDVQLAFLHGQLRIIGVDIGPWGLARRLGLAEVLSGLSTTFHLKVPEGIVSWDLIEPLSQGVSGVHLKVSRDRLTRMHPADLAEIYSELGYDQRSQLLSELDDAQVADVLEEMEPDEAAEVLGALGNERAADVLEEMEPDDAADVLGELSERKAEQLIELMDVEEAEEVRELLAYEEDTAGALMTTNFVSVPAQATVGDALHELTAQEAEVEVFAYVYLIDGDERLEGVVSLREMLVSDPARALLELSPPQLYRVAVDDDADEALHLLVKYGLLAVPVIEDGDRLAGVITLHDAIYSRVPEHLR